MISTLVRNSTGSIFRFAHSTLSSAFEIRAQGSTPSEMTELGSYLVAAFHVLTAFFHSDPHFDVFLATASQRTAPPYYPIGTLYCFALETSS